MQGCSFFFVKDKNGKSAGSLCFCGTHTGVIKSPSGIGVPILVKLYLPAGIFRINLHVG